jgi:hypothetical protein
MTMDAEMMAKMWQAAGFEVEREPGTPTPRSAGDGGLNFSNDGLWVYREHQDGWENDFWRPIPDLLTGDGMLMLLEAMRAKGWSYKLYDEQPPWSNTATHRGVWLGGPRQQQASVDAATLPEAVLEAAAIALGVADMKGWTA